MNKCRAGENRGTCFKQETSDTKLVFWSREVTFKFVCLAEISTVVLGLQRLVKKENVSDEGGLSVLHWDSHHLLKVCLGVDPIQGATLRCKARAPQHEHGKHTRHRERWHKEDCLLNNKSHFTGTRPHESAPLSLLELKCIWGSRPWLGLREKTTQSASAARSSSSSLRGENSFSTSGRRPSGRVIPETAPPGRAGQRSTGPGMPPRGRVAMFYQAPVS